MHLFDQAQKSTAELDTVCYNVVLSIFRDIQWWEQALVTFEQMQKSGPLPSVVSYSTAVSACETSTCWQVAIDLLQSACERRHATDTILLCAATSACGRALQWKLALHLAGRTVTASKRDSGIDPKAVAALNAAMTAFGVFWEKALQLLARIQYLGMQPDIISYGATMQSCDRASQWMKVEACSVGDFVEESLTQ